VSSKGDRVLVYMPMVPEAVFAMLACARIGAIHSVVFGGFAPAEVAARIDDAKPKVILSASRAASSPTGTVPYKPFLDEGIARRAQAGAVVILQRSRRGRLGSGTSTGRVHLDAGRGCWADCVEVDATDPLYILYTSGTTGKPKGIVRDNGGHAVALRWSMRNIYDVAPGETMFTASATSAGSSATPTSSTRPAHGRDDDRLRGQTGRHPRRGRVLADHRDYGAVTMFTAPTAFRAIKKEDPSACSRRATTCRTSGTLFLAGERLDPDTYHWATDPGRPVIDNWWQTETGWPIAANLRGLEPTADQAGLAVGRRARL
jgi:propionyl-CoA synthetase